MNVENGFRKQIYHPLRQGGVKNKATLVAIWKIKINMQQTQIKYISLMFFLSFVLSSQREITIKI